MRTSFFLLALVFVACAQRQHREGSDDILVRDRHTTRMVKIRGTVLDRKTQEPIAGAQVLMYMTMRPVELEVVTDANGRFRARGFPAGDIGICVEHGLGWEMDGFRTRPGQRFDVTITLPRRGGPGAIIGNHQLSNDPPNCRMFKRRGSPRALPGHPTRASSSNRGRLQSRVQLGRRPGLRPTDLKAMHQE